MAEGATPDQAIYAVLRYEFPGALFPNDITDPSVIAKQPDAVQLVGVIAAAAVAADSGNNKQAQPFSFADLSYAFGKYEYNTCMKYDC